MIASTRTRVPAAAAAAAVGWLLGLPLLLLAGGAAAVAPHGRFAAIETGAVLSPREYMVSPAHPLEKRQQGGCRAGFHACDEIGVAGENLCCPNDQYCIIDPRDTSRGACCHIGIICGGSPCEETSYQCNSTTTLTLTTTSPTLQTLTTTSLIPACCPRTCTLSSMFRCPTSLGGGCCAHGSTCASSGQCIYTPPPSSTIDPSLIAPSGCTTGQITCAATLGGGCCALGQTCTAIPEGQESAGVYCAAGEPTGSGVSVIGVEDDDDGGGGLESPGAIAGVVVGVVVGVGLMVGVWAWWFLRRRRRRRESEVGGGSSSARPRVTGVVGRIVGGSGTGGGREMSEENSDIASRSGRLGGLAQDYFGPAPGIGPYSETHSGSAVTTPGMDRGGVPLQPHEPGDIAVPVEIDSRLRDTRRAPPTGLAISPAVDRSHDSDDGHERYELYGSDVGQISPTLPSPYIGGLPNPDERPR